MANISSSMKNLFWKLPLPGSMKEKMRVKYAEKKFANEAKSDGSFQCVNNQEVINEFAHYVLESPTRVYEEAKAYEQHEKSADSATLIAYYLTQYSPDTHNDEWWGKGVTEWNNVSKAVPQFPGHRQPRLPGELGFYDLRIRDVMARQIEMAKNYGVNVFSFYYYWFAGERILEKPLNMFLEDKTLDMQFMFCWANENWTKRFSGTNEGILIGMENTVQNYKDFIHEILPYLKDERYFKVQGKPALQVYRPELIPKPEEVLAYWRSVVKEEYGMDLYLLALQTKQTDSVEWCKKGFDAEYEWMQGSIRRQCKDITGSVKAVRKDFSGQIIDYADMVCSRKYIIPGNDSAKVYPAVMPTWDNSARRNNKGTIWLNSTPALYKEWLTDTIRRVQKNKLLEEPLVFINAWNEWGEGTYLEPDHDYGFAYLEATWEAKEEAGNEVRS